MALTPHLSERGQLGLEWLQDLLAMGALACFHPRRSSFTWAMVLTSTG